jgi:hypothetical protein
MRAAAHIVFFLSTLSLPTLSLSEDKVSNMDGDCMLIGELIRDAGGRTLLLLQSEARLRQLSKQNAGQHLALFQHLDGADARTKHIGDIRCVSDEPSYLEVVVEFPSAAASWYRLVVPVQRGSPDFCAAQVIRVASSS